MAKMYSQIKGLEYFNTYFPIGKMITIIMVISLTTINNCFVYQLHVNNAFLHGDLQEDVYMTIPLGITYSKLNQVYKLLKSLYGLKQAIRKCYEKLTCVLIVHQFH